MKPALFLSLTLLAASHVALAADDSCKNAMTTLEINDCMQKQFESADKRLNLRYQELLQKLRQNDNSAAADKDKPASLLAQAQRKWIAFRDADCDAKYQIYIAGTIRNAVYLGCKIERTEQRIKELDSALW